MDRNINNILDKISKKIILTRLSSCKSQCNKTRPEILFCLIESKYLGPIKTRSSTLLKSSQTPSTERVDNLISNNPG